MAINPYVNKVVYDNQTLIDISDSNINAANLPLGSVAYDASGARITGNTIVYNVLKDTTANWDTKTSFVPEDDDIIIYTDRDIIEEDGVIKNVPGIKIGDGNAYVVDLPFVDAVLRDTLLDHINNTSIHITTAEREFWNNKLNLSIIGEELQFTRQ